MAGKTVSAFRQEENMRKLLVTGWSCFIERYD
jgi:hypothetical protein